MSSPANFAAASAINIPHSTVNNRAISPLLCAYHSLRITNPSNRGSNSSNLTNLILRQSIKSSASDSTAIIDTPPPESSVKIGARVRVTVPLTVYHIPKVPELDLNGKEGKIKEDVTVWKGKYISANFPYKIEFLEVLEGRGDKPVKFFAHLRDDEFEYID